MAELENLFPQPGSRKSTFTWEDTNMSGKIRLTAEVELAFEDEEPFTSQIVARELRDFANRLDPKSEPDKNSTTNISNCGNCRCEENADGSNS